MFPRFLKDARYADERPTRKQAVPTEVTDGSTGPHHVAEPPTDGSALAVGSDSVVAISPDTTKSYSDDATVRYQLLELD